MEKKEVSFSYTVYPDKQSLTDPDRNLLLQAREAAKFAYAPYSKFKVGVAILTSDDYVVTGSNQENGAFPVGQCAERVALYRLTHELGRVDIKTIAIMVDSEHATGPASPCGSCRQMLHEYRKNQSKAIRLLLGSVSNPTVYVVDDLQYLLPLAFDGTFLGK